jgi:hypothetical protein
MDFDRTAADMAGPVMNGRGTILSLKETVYEAWRTLAAVPDPDARFRRGAGGAWPLQTVSEWHAYTSEFVQNAPLPRVRPSPQAISRMEAVMTWMAWLRRKEGDIAIRRLIMRSQGRQWHELAYFERCSERTVQNRVDRGMSKILKKFLDVSVDVAVIEEPPPQAGRIRGFGEPSANDGAPGQTEVVPGKVYIDGVGFMLRGVVYDSAQEYQARRWRR